MVNDYTPSKYSVSIKGVVLNGDKVILLKNERNEWELPGGKLEPGEIPEETVAREIGEELGITVDVGPILDCWVYRISQDADVLIVTYGCYPQCFTTLFHSEEHRGLGLFTLDQLPNLDIPHGYRKSIERWFHVSEYDIGRT